MPDIQYSSALVTGAGGFIGSNIVERLLKEGLKVIAFDHFSTEKGNLAHLKNDQNLSIVKGDIQDEGLIDEKLKGVDVIFHNAAFGPVARTIKEPEMTNHGNIDGTLKLLKAAVANKTKRFIFASTVSVYGVAPAPFREDGILIPVTPYGASKIAGEAYCSVFFHLYKLETVSLRYFNVYGPRNPTGDKGGLIPRIVEKMVDGIPITIFGDGKQTRDFTYVDDIVEANVLSTSSKDVVGKSVNIGTGTATSVNEIVNIVESALGKKNYPVTHTETMPEESFFNYADLTNAKRLLGYKPRVTIKEGIDKYIKWWSSVSRPNLSYN